MDETEFVNMPPLPPADKPGKDLLLKPGVYEKTEPVPALSDHFTPMPFSSVATLVDIAKDYTFFSHASILLFSGLPFDPVQQFYMLTNSSDSAIAFKLDKPIFSGHEQHPHGKLFNHMLFAVPNNTWKKLLFHLGTLGVGDKTTKHLIHIIPQKLPLLDMVYMSKQITQPNTDQLPMVEVYLFALDGNKTCIHYTPPLDPLTHTITLRFDEPNMEMLVKAKHVFGDKAHV